MTTQPSLKQAMKDLQPGDSLVLTSHQKEQTARSYASDLGFLLMRRYTVSRNRQTRSITVTRLQ